MASRLHLSKQLASPQGLYETPLFRGAIIQASVSAESRRLRRKRRTAGEEDAMPSPRTWNRREFNITQNGYFTILKSSGWFSTVPSSEGFRYFGKKSKGAASPQAPNEPAEINAASPALASTSTSQLLSSAHSGSPASAIRLQTIDSGITGRNLMRLALIVLSATALAWVLLWCTAFT
jgi:hypothetical protein